MRYPVTILLALLWSPSASADVPPGKPPTDPAHQAINLSQLPDDIPALQSLLQKYPQDPAIGVIHTRLASSYLRLNRPQEAERQYLAAAEFYQSDPIRLADTLTALTDFYTRQKKFAQAIQTLQHTAKACPRTRAGLEAPFRIAALYEQQALLNDPEKKSQEEGEISKGKKKLLQKALKAYRQALSAYPERLEKALKALTELPPGTRGLPNLVQGAAAAKGRTTSSETTGFGTPNHAIYFANRDRLAFPERRRDVLLRIASLYDLLGNSRKAASLRETLRKDFSRSPVNFSELLNRADRLLEQSQYPKAFAVAWTALRWPRPTPAVLRARFAVNQRYLNLRRTIPSRTNIARLFALLHKASHRSPLLPDEQYDKLAALWLPAWNAVVEQNFDRAYASYAKFAPLHANTVFEALGGLGQAKVLALQGQYPQAIQRFSALSRTAAGKWPCIAEAARFDRAVAFLRWGHLDSAEEILRPLAGPKASRNPGLRERARYRLAQCYEFQGDFNRAARLYAKTAQTARDQQLLALARNSRIRVESASKTTAPFPPRVQYLGEDRTTSGDWHGSYGHQAYILCGQCVPRDIVGNRVRPAFYCPPTPLEFKKNLGNRTFSWKYSFRCATRADRARRWLTKQDDPMPTSLFDPMVRARSMANWDDHAEQWPLGTPVDLIVNLDIPPGLWRVSLYFVNDPSYYEPSRRYVVWAMDDARTFLAGTEVEDFLNGLYKHFAIVGPLSLRFHIYRGMSLNTLLSGVFLDPLIPARTNVPGPQIQTDPSNPLNNLLLSASGWLENASLERKALPDFKQAENLRKQLAERVYSRAGSQPAKELARAHAAWALWRYDRLLGKGKLEEKNALHAFANALVAGRGLEKADAILKTLAQTVRLPSETAKAPLPGLAHAEWIEEVRLSLNTKPNKRQSLLESLVDTYYPIDRAYGRRMFSLLLDHVAATSGNQNAPPWFRKRALTERVARRWDLAEMTYRKLEQIVPPGDFSPDDASGLIRTLVRQQKHQEATKRLESQLRALKNPRARQAGFMALVAEYTAAKNPDLALQAAEKYRNEKGMDNRTAANMYYLIGAAYKGRNKVHQARQALEQAIQHSPESNFASLSQAFLDRLPPGPATPPTRTNQAPKLN